MVDKKRDGRKLVPVDPPPGIIYVLWTFSVTVVMMLLLVDVFKLSGAQAAGILLAFVGLVTILSLLIVLSEDKGDR